MVVNNWHLIMKGHVTMTSKAARTFFFVYYLFVVLVVNNVIVAFLLDAFIKIHPLMRSRKEASDMIAKRGDVNQGDGDGDGGHAHTCVRGVAWRWRGCGAGGARSIPVCAVLLTSSAFSIAPAETRRGCKRWRAAWRRASRTCGPAARSWTRWRKSLRRRSPIRCSKVPTATALSWAPAWRQATRPWP